MTYEEQLEQNIRFLEETLSESVIIRNGVYAVDFTLGFTNVDVSPVITSRVIGWAHKQLSREDLRSVMCEHFRTHNYRDKSGYNLAQIGAFNSWTPRYIKRDNKRVECQSSIRWEYKSMYINAISRPIPFVLK